MPVSEAQKRATAKYEKEHVKRFVLKFYPADAPLLDHLRGMENMSSFLKQAIARDKSLEGLELDQMEIGQLAQVLATEEEGSELFDQAAVMLRDMLSCYIRTQESFEGAKSCGQMRTLDELA